MYAEGSLFCNRTMHYHLMDKCYAMKITKTNYLNSKELLLLFFISNVV